MSIAASLRDDVLDNSKSMSICLRKARVLAAELDHEDFKTWVQSELFGYRGNVEVPEYRIFRTNSYGTFAGPFGSQVNNYILPVFNLSDGFREFATQVILSQPISEMEALAKKGTDYFEPWPAEGVLLARDKIQISGGYLLVAARKPLPSYLFEGVVETTRNRLLEFLIELQKVAPEILKLDEVAAGIPSATVSNIFNTTITGGHHVIAAGSGFSQQVHQVVVAGDVDSLSKYLHFLGVPAEDANALRQAIESDGEPKSRGSYGAAVKKWLTTATQKAIAGGFKFGMEIAVPLIVKALEQYYGWS
jgi:hypothetical protein